MRIVLMIALLSTSILCSKVLIITHAYNRPDFIEIQEKTFKRFLQDEYEFVVFNDAPDPKIRTTVKQVCTDLQLRCFDISQEIHDRPYLKRWPGESYNNSAVRCANVVQYSLDILGLHHNDIVMIIDSDMFLVKSFNLREYLDDAVIAGVDQERDGKHYLWNGLVLINVPLLPNKNTLNFNCGKLGKTAVDVGGQTYHYFKKHPKLSIKYINVEHFGQEKPVKYTETFLTKQDYFDIHARNFLAKKPENVEFLAQGSFLHYRSGGNWDGKSAQYHAIKTQLLDSYMDSLLQ